MKLSNQKLLKEQAYIDGAWVSGKSNFEVTNPADGAVLAGVPNLGAAETQKAITAAKKAFPAWAALTAKERGAILRKWNDLILEHADDLAALLTAEQGKPLAESKSEILYGASFIDWFAEEGKRAYGDTIPSPIKNARIITIRQPIGVCAMITPWNFPHAMITRKAAPALAAGCTIVLKPASETPLSALALAVLAEDAGIPAGVINIITTDDSKAVGKVLCESPDVRKLSFTGSTATGKILMRQCADTIKKLSLELGGNAPFIVFDDADLDAAVAGAITCKFRNAGQTCVCANRIYVQEGIYESFAKKFTAEVAKLTVGPGDQKNVKIGPLINAAAVEKVKAHIANAQKLGAEILLGGTQGALDGTFFEPTVIKGATEKMKIAQEETFGPVGALFKFKDEADALRQANDTPFGLASYFYARDIGRIWRVSEALEYGMVAVNTAILSTEVAPFGGVKESGLGREGSKYGLDEYLEIKYVLQAGLA
ncbi:MAG: NAD-dependent succinate-semialdehyde dehydrogenase [Alphaproteobacteria bacterium]|nr:NAD-dependent succinate-semialdehyde dehydrogenase [Alphaproteobacteria bacterium]